MRHRMILLTTIALASVACNRESGQTSAPPAGGGTSPTSQGQPPPPGGNNQRVTPTPATPGATRSVVINGLRLDDRTVQQIEQAYNVRVMDGDYWYDRMTGAWGVRGGPTVGVVLPGLGFGGQMAADASNGNTGVFVNGRQLHAYDVARLQQIGQVVPGRYWMNASGDFGLEGGLRIGNIYEAAAAANAPRQGILSTYDKTGVAIIGGDVLIR